MKIYVLIRDLHKLAEVVLPGRQSTNNELPSQDSGCSPLQLQKAAANSLLWCLAGAHATSAADAAAVAHHLLGLQPVFAELYSVEDVAVIEGIIACWDTVASILVGKRSFSSSAASALAAATTSKECFQSVPPIVSASANQDKATTSATDTTTTTSSSSSSSSLLQHMQFLLQAHPAVLAAILGLLHRFAAATGLNPLQQYAGSSGCHVTLLLLFAHAHVAHDCCAPLQQLLDLLGCPPAAAVRSFTGAPAVSGMLPLLAAAAPLTDAFTICTQLAQLAAVLPQLQPAWGMQAYSATSTNATNSCFASQQEQALTLAAAVGACLQGAYCPQQGPATQDSPYSAAVVHLLHSLCTPPSASAPCAAAAASGAAAQAATGGAGGTGEAPPGPAPGAAAGTAAAAPSKAQAAAHQQWLETDPIQALAQLSAAYPHPHLLMRCLLALRAPPASSSGTGQPPPPAAAAAAAKAASQAKAAAASQEAAVFAQVCRVLETVFMPRGGGQHRALLLRQLLSVYADVLHPAANCGVGVRCAALQRMSDAIDEFLEEEAGDEGTEVLQLQEQLWSEHVLAGLLFTLSHDSAVRARRLAMQLLGRVAVPVASEAGGQLAAVLADKCQDKDVQVQVAALELLVQMPLPVLLKVLQEEQWWRVLQAGLQLAPKPNADDETGQQQQSAAPVGACGDAAGPHVGEETAVRFAEVLKEIMRLPAGSGGGEAVAVPAAWTPVWRVQHLVACALQAAACSGAAANIVACCRGRMSEQLGVEMASTAVL